MYDGAMGTMIQNQGKWLDEAAYRGECFAIWSCNVKGNNDLLTLSQPAVIKVRCYIQYNDSVEQLNIIISRLFVLTYDSFAFRKSARSIYRAALA
jgi:hypothetical protein